MNFDSNRIRLKWDRFLCRILGHNWHEVEEGDEKFEFEKAWFICLRCAKAESQKVVPPNCQCGFISNEDILKAGFELLELSKKDLEFIEFQKTIRKQIEGGNDGKNKRD